MGTGVTSSTMHIGHVAELTGLSLHTLRHVREVMGIVEGLPQAHPAAADGLRHRLADHLQLARQ